MSGKRAKGFIHQWNPKKDTLTKINQIQEIVWAWADARVVPVKNRTVYYKMTANHGYPKTDNFSDAINDLLTKMRRAYDGDLDDLGIPWQFIRDEGATPPARWWCDDVDELKTDLKEKVKNFETDKLAGQDRRFLVWLEAGGLVAAARKAADDYSVPVATGGRQDSYYQKRKAFEWIEKCGYPVTIFHIGDYDGQGISIFETLAEDILTMAGEAPVWWGEWDRNGKRIIGVSGDAHIEFVRLGVLPEQIDEYSLGYRTAKGTKLDKKYGLTIACEAEAFDPIDIESLVRDAIEERIDMDIYSKTTAALDEQKKSISNMLGDI